MSEHSQLARTASIAFLWNHAAFLLSTVILALTTWVLARWLEPERYGIYTSVMAFAALVQWLTALGFEGALNVHLPRLRDQSPRARFLIRRMLGWRALLLVAACAAIALWDRWGGGFRWANLQAIGPYFPLAVLAAALTLISGLLVRIMETLFRVKALTLIRTATLLLALGAYAAALTAGYGVAAVLWIAVGVSGLALAGYLWMCRDFILGPVTPFPTADIYRFGRTMWLTGMVTYALGKNMDVIIMTFYGVAAAQIGFYQIVYVLTDYAYVAATRGMSGVLQSAFAHAHHAGGARSLARGWNSIMKFHILACAPPVLFLVLFAEPLFAAILPKYLGAAPLLRVYGLLILMVTFLGGGTHITVFYTLQMERLVLYISLVAGAMNLGWDLIVIHYLGALGALLATGTAGITVRGLELWIVRRKIAVQYPVRFAALNGLCLSGAGAAAVLVPVGGLPGLLLKGLAFLAGYALVARFARPLAADDVAALGQLNARLAGWLAPFCRKDAAG